MKVKEIYHYLNTMTKWEDDIVSEMSKSDLFTKTTEYHKKSEVISTEQDETREIVNEDKKYTYDDCFKLWVDIIDEKKKIYNLIEKAKNENGISDTMLSINKSYRVLISALKLGSRNSVKNTRIKRASGYIKGTDGVGAYEYDVEVVTTPKYDTKYYLDNLDKYTNIADEISERIDTFNTTTDIDYTPRWSIHASVENLLQE
ncbi:MAG: hypothetical protein IKI71_05180 [Lachnospiraceae bacterium]|nr:hypothetical protein [Lachnospiraceae bacterium]